MGQKKLLERMYSDSRFAAAMARPLSEAEKRDGHEVIAELRLRPDPARLEAEMLTSEMDRRGVDGVTAFRMRAYFAAQHIGESPVFAVAAQRRVSTWDRPAQ